MKKTKKIYQLAIVFLLCFLLLLEVASSQMKIFSPSSGDSLIVGEDVEISWGGAGARESLFSLYYSNDGGVSWVLIAKNLTSEENKYIWKLPYLSQKKIIFKVEEETKIEIHKKWENLSAHLVEARNCEFSSNGKYFLTSGDDGYFRIWNVENNSMYAEYFHLEANSENKSSEEDEKDEKEEENNIYPVLCAQFFGGIDSVVYCCGNSIWLWNSKTNSSEKLFEMPNTSYFVDVNYSSACIAACSHSFSLGEDENKENNSKETVIIYSLTEKKILKKIFNSISPEDNYYRCRYSPSGQYLAFVGYNKIINLYDIQRDTLHSYLISGGTMAIMGVDFSFDESEVVVCGLDGVVRRFSVPTLDTIASYNNIMSSHSRSIRYVSQDGDFIAGGVGSSNFVYGNLINKEHDSINVNFQITDVTFYKDKYYLVAGREPRQLGKFVLFELVKPLADIDTVSCEVFYKFTASIAKNQKAKYNNIINFYVDFTHKYNVDSLPFSEASAYALVKFPYKMLDFSVIATAPYSPPTSEEIVYAVRIDNILIDSRYYNLKARVLLAPLQKDSITFEFCYSSNNLILFETVDSEIDIQSECSEDNPRFIISAAPTLLEIEETSKEIKTIKLNIGDDDGHILTISNSQGNIVMCEDFNKSGSYEVVVSTNNLAPGAYFVQLISKNNIIKNTLTNKFILLK